MLDKIHYEIFRARGISNEIRDARPYISWTVENRDPVRQAYHLLPPGDRGWIVGIAGQSGGIIIERYPPPGLGLGPVVPEIRPDCSVNTRPAYKEPDPAKYLFPPNPKKLIEWQDDHDERFASRPEARAQHVARCHGGIDYSGPHTHTRKIKDRENGHARRLDVHPFAPGLIEQAPRVFFCLEGCLKADAILSTGEAVFSVPSVTLWDAPELGRFAERYLGGKTVVYVVCDSDWYENDLVIAQAMLCRQYLRRLGLKVYVAAPPYAPPPPGKKKPELNGVDDHIGAGGEMDDLVVIGREPSRTLGQWMREQQGRIDGIARDAQMIEALSYHAKPDGTTRRCVSTYERILDTHHENVRRALESLEKRPSLGGRGSAIRVTGSLATRRGVWKAAYFDRSLDWEELPLITIAPELRAIEVEGLTIRQLEGLKDDSILGFVTRDIEELKALRTR